MQTEHGQAYKARVIAWVLFILTMPPTDHFFTKPIIVESAHPYPPNTLTTTVVRRPGASMLEIELDPSTKLAPATADTLAYYTDRECTKEHGRIRGEPETWSFVVDGNEVTIRWVAAYP
jgi:hypothetical protein